MSRAPTSWIPITTTPATDVATVEGDRAGVAARGVFVKPLAGYPVVDGMEESSMSRSRFGHSRLVASLAIAAVVACEQKTPEKLAPVASAPLVAPMTAAPGAKKLVVASAGSSVKFLMDSPLEKIDGDAPDSVSGELFIELANLEKSTALVKVDLDKLTLYQQKRPDESGAYGERKKSDLQNEHARDWLQIEAKDGEVTAAQAAQNRSAEFRIERLSDLSATNVLTLPGAERTVTGTAQGAFRLHGRQAKKSAKVSLVFAFDGNELKSLRVKSVEPVKIALAEFEVHPRDAAGKFVQSVSEVIAGKLKGKVASEAPVSFEFTAAP